MIELVLTVVVCSGTGLPVSECDPEKVAVYDTQTWSGPTETDMIDCLNQADTLNGNGENAKCWIDRKVPEKVSTDYRPSLLSWTF